MRGLRGRRRLPRLHQRPRIRTRGVLHRVPRRDGRIHPSCDGRRPERRSTRTRHSTRVGPIRGRFGQAIRSSRPDRAGRASCSGACRIRNVYVAGRRITASLDRYPLIHVFNWITRNQLSPRQSPFSSVVVDHCATLMPLAPGDEIPSAPAAAPRLPRGRGHTESADARHGDRRGRADRVRAVMSAIDSYAKRLSPPGSLIGVSTIHFVRWMIIDDGRRLLMISDYDGSWESYIDEFAEMILSGLDAIWCHGRVPAGRRPRSARLQAVPAQPPGAVRRVLQRLPRRDGAQHRTPRRGRRARWQRRTTPLPVDALADIQGFITSGYGHLPQSRLSVRPLIDAAGRTRWLAQIAPVDHDGEAVAEGRERREDQAGHRGQPRVHRDGLAALRTAARCSARSRRSSRKASRTGTARESSATPKRATPTWEFGGPEQPRLHAVLIVHAATADALEACLGRSARCSRSAGGVVELPGSSRAIVRAATRAVRIPRRHRAAVDRGHRRRRRADRRVHPRLPEPLPVHPAVASRAGRRWTRDGILPPLENPYHASERFATSAGTARSSSTASCNRTSPASGGS